MSANLSAFFYLISGILFILALRGLSSPETSRKGNLFGIIGMLIAIGVTFLSVGNFSTGFLYLLGFLLIGGSIGPVKLSGLRGRGISIPRRLPEEGAVDPLSAFVAGLLQKPKVHDLHDRLRLQGGRGAFGGTF